MPPSGWETTINTSVPLTWMAARATPSRSMVAMWVSSSPSSKAAFYLGFLERMAPLLADQSRAVAGDLNECARCGEPTTGEICAFCRLVETASAHDPVPVELVLKGRR